MNYLKRFQGVMLILGGSGASSFEGMNITKFFERYKKLNANFSLSKPKVMKRVSRYYKIIIGQFIKNLPKYKNSV